MRGRWSKHQSLSLVAASPNQAFIRLTKYASMCAQKPVEAEFFSTKSR
jgi:hypothetical protein